MAQHLHCSSLGHGEPGKLKPPSIGVTSAPKKELEEAAATGLTEFFGESQGQREELELVVGEEFKMERPAGRYARNIISASARVDVKNISLLGVMNACHFDRKCHMP